MKNYKIAIVNSSTFGRNFSDLRERLNKIGEVKRFDFDPDIKGEDLAAQLQGFHFIIASVTPEFPASFLNNMSELKLIARHGIGCDNVDTESASKQGVIVTRVGGEFERDAVAELALSLIMTCVRMIIPANQAVLSNKWEQRRQFVGWEVSKMTAGIIGYGNIGSRTAEILREGFKCEVLAYDPNVADAVIAKNGIKPVTFTEILSRSDLLSFHASLNSENYQFVDKDEFAIMKDGVIIVNTARGELINEVELAAAAKRGKVGAVGLDVAQREPISPDNPLNGLDNVHILPHIGSYTQYSLWEMDKKMVEDIEKYVAGETPEEIVNPEVLR